MVEGHYISNLEAPGLMVSNKKIFQDFHYVSLYKTSDPWVGAIFDPRAII